MSSTPFERERQHLATPEQPYPVEKQEESRPVTILSELDSYIAGRMKEQPTTLEEVKARIEMIENRGQHRLVLPDYFERLSNDNQKHPGEYIFKWVLKDKRSIDRHLNQLGWTLANRSYFPNAPRYLFTANGGVEVGDAILAFMPAKRALELRAAPGKRSIERIRSQVTNVEADYALMTGNPKDEKVYKPELGVESVETSEAKVPGVMAEGRDF